MNPNGSGEPSVPQSGKSASSKEKRRSTATGGRPASCRKRVYQHLVRKIVNGEFPAGAPLSEVPLAREIRGHRTPVREAIGQLVSEGVLQEISGRGTIVIESTRLDIVELYQLREALETYAVAMAAERGVPTRDLEVIEKEVEGILVITAQLEKSGKVALDGELLQRFISSDLRFHMLLLQAAGNRRIIKVVGNTRLLIRIFTFKREHHTAELLMQVHTYHRRILDAVKRKDQAAAVRLMRERIRCMDERLAEYQEDWRGNEAAHYLETT